MGGKSLLLVILTLTINGKSFFVDNMHNAPTIIWRSEWGARTPNGTLASLKVKPPIYVVIHHSASPSCATRAICQARIRAFQDYHMNTKLWQDIGYHFLVGEDGNIYEGRGWDKSGAHLPNYNHKSIGICIIGNYEKTIPNDAAINALHQLIDYGVSQGKIDDKYFLISHRQAWVTSCPGNNLSELIKSWPHWVSI